MKCQEVIVNKWEGMAVDGIASVSLSRTLEACQWNLRTWSRGKFRDISSQIQKTRAKLSVLKMMAGAGKNVAKQVK